VGALELWTAASGAATAEPGGWGFVLRESEGEQTVSELEGSGGEPATTANRMQLTVVIKGLQALTRPGTVQVHVSSAYVSDPFLNGSIDRWVQRGFKRRVGGGTAPVKHADLWQELYMLSVIHQLEWARGGGQAGAGLKRRAERLADAGRRANAGLNA
jgi:ribonuclease HI